MSGMVIDGKKSADDILAKLTNDSSAQPKPAKFLAAVLVGDDKSSASFLAQKEKVAKRLGVDFRLYKFPAEIKNDDLRAEVGKIANHKTCGGVIVQLPLPEHLNRHYILNTIPPEKDVDVLGERSLGAFYAGRSKVLPPAAGAVEAILAEVHKENKFPPVNECAVAVVGLGILVGRPIANWAMRRARETFLLRSTSDFEILKKADLIIAGVGKAGLIKPDMIKPGAGIIDFGYDGGRGDFDANDADAANDKPKPAFYTPTPGGTGPILVAKLFENFYALTKISGGQ